jgi:G:T/U-mismatch repair DNA glycosylase
MFIHQHPYPPFLFEEATRWIVGTLPPPRFTQGHLRPGDVDFSYGSRDGQLWPILDRIFNLNLLYENTLEAVEQRKRFLKASRIGICDIVDRADRQRIDATDLGMDNIQLRDMLGLLRQYPKVQTLLFTGGNSRNGPEYLFRKLLHGRGLKLEPVVAEVPRIHRFFLPVEGGTARELKTVSLTAPSGSANRAVGSMPEYKARKAKDQNYTVVEFRVEQYRQFFLGF